MINQRAFFFEPLTETKNRENKTLHSATLPNFATPPNEKQFFTSAPAKKNSHTSETEKDIFIKESELSSLLPKEEFNIHLTSHANNLESELKVLYQSSRKKVPSFKKEDVENRLRKQRDQMLALAIKTNDAVLRDIAIGVGANIQQALLPPILCLTTINETENIYLKTDYSTLAFLLDSKIDLLNKLEPDVREMMWETALKMKPVLTLFLDHAFDIGPTALNLFLDYAFDKGNKFDYNEFCSFFQNKEKYLAKYIETHEIDELLKIEYLKPHIVERCRSVVEQNNDLELFALLGDEEGLRKSLSTLKIKECEKDKQIACRSFKQACLFKRENILKLFFEEDIDLELTPLELYSLVEKAIAQRNVQTIKLLLSCDKTDIHLISNNQSLYKIAMESGYAIKQLFLDKNKELINAIIKKTDNDITRLKGQANSWLYGWGTANKIAELTTALTNAQTYWAKNPNITPEDFENFKLGNEKSIAEAAKITRMGSSPQLAPNRNSKKLTLTTSLNEASFCNMKI